MKILNLVFLLMMHFAVCLSLNAGQFAAIGKTSLPPKIDGIADEKCWENCPSIAGLSMPEKLIYATEQTTLKLCYDATNLYGFFRCEQKGIDKLPQGSKIPDDNTMWKGNGVEMFFLAAKPTAKKYEAKHFIINPEGTINDAAIASLNGEITRTPTWNSSIKLSVAKTNNHWSGEFQIPWKSLGISPALNTTFTFNLVRNNPSQNESSSWSRLEKHDWWQVEAFSQIQLAEAVVGFDFITLPAVASSTLNLQCHYSEGIKPIAKVTAGKSTHEGIPNAEKQIKIAYSVPTNTAGANPSVRMKMYNQETCLYDFLYEPLGEYISISSCNNIEEKIVLSPDFDSRITWNCRHNLPGFNNPAKGGKVKKDFEIVFDLPAGITLVGGKKVETLTFDGENYNRYVQPQAYVYNAAGWLGSALKTTLPVDATGKIRYFARWDNSSQPPQTINFEVIKMPKASPPKQFITGIYDLRFDNLSATENYRQLGINTFSVRGFDERAIQYAKDLKQAGLNVQRGPYFWTGGTQDDWKIWTKNDRSARAVDINGYYITAGNGHQLSPSYRGKYFEEAMAKELDFIRKTGITYFSFDMEGDIQPNGDKACFSDRTIAAFKTYFKEKHPQMPYMEPKVFEKSPETYPEYHTAWVNFKCYIWTDLFKEMKKRFAEALNLPVDKITFTEWSLQGVTTEANRNKSMQGKEWLEVFTIETSSYSGLDRDVRQRLDFDKILEKDFPDCHFNYLVTPCPHRLQDDRYFKTTAPTVKNEFKYKTIQYAALGASGSIIWTNRFVNLDTLRQFAEAIYIINKVENIVINGVRIKNISTDQPKCEITDNFSGKGNATWKDQDSVFVCGLELADQALICVSEYRQQKEMAVTVNYQVKQPVEIIDVETDKVIGKMTPSDTSFKITLPADNRCRLFLLKPQK